MEPGAIGKYFLREARLLPQPPQVRGEALLCPHAAIVLELSQ